MATIVLPPLTLDSSPGEVASTSPSTPKPLPVDVPSLLQQNAPDPDSHPFQMKIIITTVEDDARPSSPYATLLGALEAEDEEEAIAHLEQGASVEVRNGDGLSPLHFSVASGYHKLTPIILEKNPALEARTR